jgi:hypothetical protein
LETFPIAMDVKNVATATAKVKELSKQSDGNCCRFPGHCGCTDAARLASGSLHANTIDAIVVMALIIAVEVVAKMDSTARTTNFAFGTQA